MSNSLDPITGIILNAINDATNGLPSGGPGRYPGDGNPFTGAGNFTVSEFTADVQATPLPAALPLFATGLGALGLLGWRRKRKAQGALSL
jgi:hypothetical protein